MDKHTLQATIKFYDTAVDGIKQYRGLATFTLIKSKTGWMINDFK
jgi:hypothetical protein